MGRGTKRSSVRSWSVGKLTKHIKKHSALSQAWVLEDDDGTEVSVANEKEVKYISGGGLKIDWTDTSDGSDSDPYDLTFTIDPTDGTEVNIAAGDLVLIADVSDSNNLKKAEFGYAWDGTNFYVNGKIGVGVVTPSYALDLPNNSDATGTARANAFITYSSRKLKKNINQIQKPLNIVKNLRGVTFDWKDTNKREIGLIAEEVAKVLPEVVSYQNNRPTALDYPKLTALLIECVKEQQEKIESLEKKVVSYVSGNNKEN
jgi:hypothetical protein